MEEDNQSQAVDIDEIIDRMKTAARELRKQFPEKYKEKIDTDAALARFLGFKPQGLNEWRDRKTIVWKRVEKAFGEDLTRFIKTGNKPASLPSQTQPQGQGEGISPRDYYKLEGRFEQLENEVRFYRTEIKEVLEKCTDRTYQPVPVGKGGL